MNLHEIFKSQITGLTQGAKMNFDRERFANELMVTYYDCASISELPDISLLVDEFSSRIASEVSTHVKLFAAKNSY